MKDLQSLSLQELRELKIKWYKENTDNGNIKKLHLIARELGQRIPHNYGPKYEYNQGGVMIYVDDYGGYMTVHVKGKLTVSTHNDKLYVPGEWEEIITRLLPAATEHHIEDKSDKENNQRQKLLDELTNAFHRTVSIGNG